MEKLEESLLFETDRIIREFIVPSKADKILIDHVYFQSGGQEQHKLGLEIIQINRTGLKADTLHSKTIFFESYLYKLNKVFINTPINIIKGCNVIEFKAIKMPPYNESGSFKFLLFLKS